MIGRSERGQPRSTGSGPVSSPTSKTTQDPVQDMSRARTSESARWEVEIPAGSLRERILSRSSSASGATLKEVMARIGHSSTRAAMIYQHATRERDQAIAAALDALINEARRVPDDEEEAA